MYTLSIPSLAAVESQVGSLSVTVELGASPRVRIEAKPLECKFTPLP